MYCRERNEAHLKEWVPKETSAINNEQGPQNGFHSLK